MLVTTAPKQHHGFYIYIHTHQNSNYLTNHKLLLQLENFSENWTMPLRAKKHDPESPSPHAYSI